MKTLISFLVVIICFINEVYSQQYTWSQKNNFAGGVRYYAFAFSIGNYGYVGSGVGGNGSNIQYIYTDLWEYDVVLDTWTQKANIPGSCKSGAASFSINGIGYVSTGWSPSPSVETWGYDPITNTWTAKANFPGTPRYTTAYFVIGDYAYVGMGYSPYQKDFWKYNSLADSWTQIADIGGQPRQAAMGFSMNGYGYVFGGDQQGVFFTNQVWEYDTTLNNWSIKTFCPCYPRSAGSVFTIGSDVFIGLGTDDTATYNDFYRYTPASNSWQQIMSFPPGNRLGVISFSILNKGFVGTGSSLFYPNLQLQQDIWELSVAASVISQQDPIGELTIYPNPNKGAFKIGFGSAISELVDFEILNEHGEVIHKVRKEKIDRMSTIEINIPSLKSGIYFIRLTLDDFSKTSRFVVR